MISMQQTVSQLVAQMNLSYRYKSNAKAKTVLYMRAATAEQSSDTQRTLAQRAGLVIDQVIEEKDHAAISAPLQARDGGKRLLDILRDGDVLVVPWLDGLGRNYDDIAQNMRLFLARGVTIKTIINGLTFDARPQDATGLAIREALLSFMSAMAAAQAITHKEAQAAGIAHAKASNPSAYKGRKPSYTHAHVDQIRQLSGNGIGINEIARRLGLSKFLVSRINKNTPAAYEALERWGIKA